MIRQWITLMFLGFSWVWKKTAAQKIMIFNAFFQATIDNRNECYSASTLNKLFSWKFASLFSGSEFELFWNFIRVWIRTCLHSTRLYFLTVTVQGKILTLCKDTQSNICSSKSLKRLYDNHKIILGRQLMTSRNF